MTPRSTSRSRASCCCPCGLAPVVTVAAGTRWGDATPCYASHHMMMLVLLYGLLERPRQAKVYRVLAVYDFRPNTKTKINRTSGQTDKRSVFFFLHVAIRNSRRSNNMYRWVDVLIGSWFLVYRVWMASRHKRASPLPADCHGMFRWSCTVVCCIASYLVLY